MVELALIGFIAFFLGLGLRRPFLWVLLYLYVDIVSPQKMAYNFLNTIPLSMIVIVVAALGWMFLDNKENTRVSMRQVLMALLLLYCGISTQSAEFPTFAADKWSWVWKSLIFAIFLPFTLRTRLRIEAAVLVMVLAAGSIMMSGAMKTLTGGGGYGTLKFFVNDNTGLFEGSTLSCVAIAVIPLVLWLAKYGTIFPPDSKVRVFAAGLVFSALLIPIGTETRTGLLCAGLLGIMMLRSVQNRGLYLAILLVGGIIALPLLPSTFSTRINTIQNNQADESASTRVAVWKWTLGYATDHPLGGGFDSYRGNHLKIQTSDAETSGNTTTVMVNEVEDSSRAFHSAYFEMLGEQGWPGLVMWLTLQISGIVQLESIRRRLRKSEDPVDIRDAALAHALQEGHFVYLLGAMFVGIAYQPFIYMLIGLQIGLVQLVRRRLAGQTAKPARVLSLPNHPAAPLGAV